MVTVAHQTLRTSVSYVAGFVFLTVTCYCQATFWETTEDIYENFQIIPSIQETRNKLMKYFLDRQDKSRGKRYTPYYDIVFVLDSSYSISEADFNLSVTAAQGLVTRFDPDTMFAAVTVSTNASVNFSFNSSKAAIENIGKIQYQGGKKNILDALKKTQDLLLLTADSGVRAGSRKRVLLVTDGPNDRKLNDTERLQKIIWTAIQLQTRGPEVFVVAVGNRIPRIEELILIASSTDVHFYRVSDMLDLKQIVDGIPVHISYQDDYFGK